MESSAVSYRRNFILYHSLILLDSLTVNSTELLYSILLNFGTASQHNFVHLLSLTKHIINLVISVTSLIVIRMSILLIVLLTFSMVRMMYIHLCLHLNLLMKQAKLLSKC